MPWNSHHVVITVRDGSGLSQATGPGTGSLSVPGLGANDGADMIDIRDRLSHYALIPGQRRTYEFTTEVVVDAGSLAANAVLSAIRREGTWVAATSIETKTDAYAVRLDVTLTNSLGLTATITLPKCHLMGEFQVDAEYTKLVISGTCYTVPTFT